MGAAGPPAVAQWERGTNVPEGIRRERLVDLLEGRRWPELRAAAIGADGLPASWDRALRWYRRGSRERPIRETAGVVVATLLDELRAVESPGALRGRYCEHHGDRFRVIAERCGLGEGHRSDLRRLEDAVYGLRWLELAGGRRLDLRHSLSRQLPLGLLDGERCTPSGSAAGSAAEAGGTPNG